MWYWPVFFGVVVLCGVVVAIELWLVARSEPGVRPWAVIAAGSAAAVPLAIVAHNVLSALIQGEEAISFILALFVAPAGLMVGAIGGGLALLRHDRDLGASILLYATGMGLFAAYALFALIVTSIVGENPSYQRAIEIVVLSIAALAMSVGVIGTARALMSRKAGGLTSAGRA